MISWAKVNRPSLAGHFEIPTLAIFDSASQGVKPVIKKSAYSMYVCGITPYDATHLGHAATYLTFDLIHRYLSLDGSSVNFVQNITDIDDPLLERAIRDKVDWQELAASQINLFRGDMVNLHIIPPNHYIGVVESMNLITESISSLVSTGNTYSVDGDLYFDVHSDPAFGSRSHLTLHQMLEIFSERGGDPDRAGKRNALDSLLWRGERAGEPSWDSPFGPGRPGWHIECSAIALHYLGLHHLALHRLASGLSQQKYLETISHSPTDTTIDIQGGGSDLIFPHHEMSASQSKAITHREFASHYVHAGMIGLDGEKMSKSLGNLVFVSQLINDGVPPAAVRWALFASHYRSDRMWSDELLANAGQWIGRLVTALSRVDVAPTAPVIADIISALADDLDTPTALKHIQKWISDTESGMTGGEAGELSRALDTILGLAL